MFLEQDKRAMRVAEEVVAGRREVLQTLSDDELRKVLAALAKKRKADSTYLAEHRAKIRREIPPRAPPIENRSVYFEDRNLLQRNDIILANRQKNLRVSSLGAARPARLLYPSAYIYIVPIMPIGLYGGVL